MRTRISILRWAIVLSCALKAFSVTAEGIPEPGLILYGVITDEASGIRLTTGSLVWTLTPVDGGAPVVAEGELQNVNDQFSYLLQIPCESPIVGTDPTPNTIPLTSAGITYERSQVLVNGELATLGPPAQATTSFGQGDRGRIERIDLAIDATFVDSDGNGIPDDWELANFNQVGIDPNADPDDDGLTNEEEWKVGTDPNDFQSQFAIIKIEIPEAGGIQIDWSSTEGRNYSVLRSMSVIGEFLPIAEGIGATPPLNSYHDPEITGDGPYFYRLRVEE